MPVTTRIISDESGSTRNASAMFSEPDAIHENTVCSTARTPPTGSLPSIVQTAETATPKASAITAVATPPETPLDDRRPIVTLKRNPRNGRSGISASTRSPLQAGKGVRAQRLPTPEQGDDNRQADRSLGRGNRHDEED